MTLNQQLRRWRGKSHQLVKKEVRLCQRDHQWERASPAESSNVRWDLWLARLEQRKLRLGAKVPLGARILCWLAEFVGYLMNRCDIGSDGKTPLRSMHGLRENTNSGI